MTVSSLVYKISYAGNGTSTAFAVPFYFLANSQLLVTLRSAAGVETIQLLDVNYTVTGAGVLTGGTVTMTVAPATGATVTISRNVPITQTTDFQPNDRLPAETLEQTVDKLTMICQQLADSSDRALRFPISDTSTDTELPTSVERANRYLRFNSSGNPIAASIIADITASASDLANPASTINTTEKATGRLVWDTTNQQLVRATGSAAGDGWDVVSSGGGTVITLPITSITGMGTGVQTFLITPTSANLRSVITDETGTGFLVFNTNPTIDGATFTGNAQTTSVAASSSSGTLLINCNDSNVFTVSMTENVSTLTLSNASDGQTINVRFTQDATGGRTITWPASFKWAGGSAGSLSSGANEIDFLVATYIDSSWYASLLKAFA
jgi:hypothetical protein